MDTAVVTGAGRGIGREAARLLAQRGMTVLCTDVDEGSARATAESIGDRAWAMALDVRDPEANRAAARAAAERGRLRVWFSSAGVLRTEKAWDHSDDDISLMAEANLLGVIWGARAALEVMRADPDGCHIVNMASMSSFGPAPGLAVYGATKHGVLGFSSSLQGDLATSGIPIRVHAVCPDTVDTGMMRENVDSPEYAVGFTGPRLLTPAEVAAKAVELIDGDRIVLSIPGWRAAFARFTGIFPRAALPLAGAFRAAGEKKRQKVAGG